MEESDPTGQGLANRIGKAEVLGSGQDVPASRRIPVQVFLQIREQLGRVLNLVQDGRPWVLRQESPRV